MKVEFAVSINITKEIEVPEEFSPLIDEDWGHDEAPLRSHRNLMICSRRAEMIDDLYAYLDKYTMENINLKEEMLDDLEILGWE